MIKKIFSLALLFSITVLYTPSAGVAAACDPLPAMGQSLQKITLTEDGTYAFKIHMYAPSADKDSLYLKIDDRCQIAIQSTQIGPGFTWVNYQTGDTAKTLTFDLKAGNHTIILAGLKPGAGADTMSIDKQETCSSSCQTPVSSIDNSVRPVDKRAVVTKQPNFILVGLAAAGIFGALGFLVWKYWRFTRAGIQQLPDNMPPVNARLFDKLVHFFRHHLISSLICGGVFVASIVVFAVGATSFSSTLETESGQLSGATTIVKDNAASGGSYVVFNNNQSTTTGGTNGSTSQNGSSTTNNNSSNGDNSTPPDNTPPSNQEAVCPAYPSFPTASCTGWQHTGVTLTTVNGIYYATTPGQVLDSKDFHDGIVVEADNVTIKRSKVEGKGSGPGAGIWVNQGVSGTLIEDVEVTSQAGFDANNENTIVDRAITGFKTNGLTMRRVYAHKMIRGLQYGCNTLIEDSYVDDEINPTGAHMSAIGGETCSDFTLTVRHNRIGLAPNVNDSAALLFYPPQVGAYGTQNLHVTYVNNLIFGGTYCMWLSSDPQFIGAVSVTNNQFGTQYYSSCGLYGTHFKDNWGSEGSATMTWTGNKWQDSGAAIAF